MPLPKKINPCPIRDVNVEVRFESTTPPDAIFGIVYNELKSTYPKIEKLPILQLPDEVRLNDPDLIFQPHYKLSNETFILQLGPKMLGLGSNVEYIGWDRYFPNIKNTFLLLERLDIPKKIIRFGMRYINYFDYDIFDFINLSITHRGEPFEMTRTLINAEIPDGKFINLLRLGNKISLKNPLAKNSALGSVIDIDTHLEGPIGEFFIQMETLIEEAHIAEKKLFFSLLKEEFLKTLNPEY